MSRPPVGTLRQWPLRSRARFSSNVGHVIAAEPITCSMASFVNVSGFSSLESIWPTGCECSYAKFSRFGSLSSLGHVFRVTIERSGTPRLAASSAALIETCGTQVFKAPKRYLYSLPIDGAVPWRGQGSPPHASGRAGEDRSRDRAYRSGPVCGAGSHVKAARYLYEAAA